MKQRPDGRWVKTVTINGKRKMFYSRAKTEKLANKDITAQMVAYEESTGEHCPFIDVADKWDSAYRLKIPDITYRKGVLSHYRRIIDFFAGYKLNEITTNDIDIFLHTLNYGQKTVASHKCILNMIFEYAILHGYIKYNPVIHVKVPKGLSKTKRELPSDEDLIKVETHFDGFALLPFFILCTGCRKSEALAITRNDIDFDKNIITIRNHVIHDGNRPIYEPVLKSDAAFRDIILLDRLKEALPKKFKGFLFSMNGDGKEPLTKGAYDKRWKKYCQEYNVKFTAHQLRHGYATMLYEAGIDVKDAQELMGHADITLTKSIYTHVRNKRKEETAAKLNSFSFK